MTVAGEGGAAIPVPSARRRRRALPIATRGAWWRVAIGLALVALLLTIAWRRYARQPGTSWQGDLPPMTAEQQALVDRLRADLTVLAVDIGERNLGAEPEALERAAVFIEQAFAAAGCAVERHEYRVGDKPCRNLIAEIAGDAKRDEIVVVGAHYDSVEGAPGANDNGTGVAGLLAFARAFAVAKPARTLRLIAFVNEEPPYFQTRWMGSLVYAKRCQERKERITAMISLETIGFYTDEADTQHFPLPALAALYPTTGDFAAVVGQAGSAALVNEVVERFRRLTRFPCEGAALPDGVDGASWSDHWSFAQCGYPALQITDTAPFRYGHYHLPTDTIDKIVWDRYARVVEGSIAVVREMVEAEAVPAGP